MKTPSKLLSVALIIAGTASSDAAGVIISNVVEGPASATWEGDTLHAYRDGTLMDGGSITMGYFAVGVSSADLDTVERLIAHLSTFTAITTAVPGSLGYNLGTANPGYADQVDFTLIGLIDRSSPLLGRMLYTVVTSAPTIGSANISSQFALLAIATFRLDEPFEESYTSNRWPGLTPLIGTIGSYTGDAGAGFGVYKTLNMELAADSSAVPESSTALLAAIGVLNLLRRRR
jgi:hypothetical protein